MARLSNNSDRDFLASPGEDFADIAKLFAYQPPELNEFFADPIVQMENRKNHSTSNGYAYETARPRQVPPNLNQAVAPRRSSTSLSGSPCLQNFLF